ncbi:MAG: endonuclease/exonuclease/phosphatase family protein [Pirellulales bacterium]
MIYRWERRWRAIRRWVSRNEWLVRLLRLPKSASTAAEPGLVMLQIDGLSRSQFEKALAHGRLPFLGRLIGRERYRNYTMYPGLPTSTPAVQAELFYGVRCAVPAFAFRDHRTGQVARMFDSHTAGDVQSRLESEGPGLLEGGSAYCNIYSGGAAEPHFCAATMGWGPVPSKERWSHLALALVWHAWSIVRIATLIAVELVLAVGDCARGILARRDLWAELKFVPSRIVISVALRELSTISASLDATRGLPVIHVNFLGYDEQAHRRGPASLFAHWTLKGIDEAIQRIWTAARRSPRRDYDVWIYSDHGQQRTIPYEVANGRTIHAAVADVFGRHVRGYGAATPFRRGGTQLERARWLGRWLDRLMGGAAVEHDPGKKSVPGDSAEQGPNDRAVEVVAYGPVGYVYPNGALTSQQREHFAQSLVSQANVPLVLSAAEPGRARAWTARRSYQLPDDAEDLFGPDHPYLPDVAQDLVALCHHPDAGPLVLCGWRREGRLVSFARENGAHAGPGPDETSAFVLVPPDVPLPRSRDFIRPADLRRAALAHLGRSAAADVEPAPEIAEMAGHPVAMPQARRTLRILTYNAHSCLGMDGSLSPSRIARVIAQTGADVVALQELDVRRLRSNSDDQAHSIARQLEMQFHFHPALRLEEEQYGDAVLSRHPMRLVRAGALPGLTARPYLEPRGAIWVTLTLDGREIQLVNTHLGLLRGERARQVEALLGDEWLGHPECKEPLIFCGDLNALPGSRVHRRLCDRLRDAQIDLQNHRPQRTFFGRYPLGRIDYIFVAGDLEVVSVEVVRTHLARVASDHLPLLVEVRI